MALAKNVAALLKVTQDRCEKSQSGPALAGPLGAVAGGADSSQLSPTTYDCIFSLQSVLADILCALPLSSFQSHFVQLLQSCISTVAPRGAIFIFFMS